MNESSSTMTVQFGTSGKNTAAAQLAEADLLRPEIQTVKINENSLTIILDDRREIKVPLDWYPRLVHATNVERNHFEIQGNALHWPELDEDIDVRGILLGRRSGENSASFQSWLRARGEQNLT